MEKKLIYGCCINDSVGEVSHRVNGKQITDRIFATWRSMIQRAYDPKLHEKFPTYVGCSVHEHWRRFSKFKLWMENQNYVNLYLDKDILIEGNKEYGPETCAFVPKEINQLLHIKSSNRDVPVGVFVKIRGQSKRYIATICENGLGRHLQSFECEKEAHKAWQEEKADVIERTVNKYAKTCEFNTQVADALMSRVWKLRLHAFLGVETKNL